MVRVVDGENEKRRDELMIVYVVFCKDYEHRKGELMGMLVERRRDTRGETRWESGVKWARQAFGHLVKDKKDIFVYPKEIEIMNDKGFLVDKGIFSKEEFLEVMKKIDQEMKSITMSGE
jgi:hypothetical protein